MKTAMYCFLYLSSTKDNVKALYKRGKAHAAVWNETQARADFAKVMELDPTLGPSVAKELRVMEEKIRAKDKEDKGRYKGLFNKNAQAATATTVSPCKLLVCIGFLITGSSSFNLLYMATKYHS